MPHFVPVSVAVGFRTVFTIGESTVNTVGESGALVGSRVTPWNGLGRGPSVRDAGSVNGRSQSHSG